MMLDQPEIEEESEEDEDDDVVHLAFDDEGNLIDEDEVDIPDNLETLL